MTRWFVEQAKPEVLRADLLRHIDEGVRAIHISLTLPLREPVRCIAYRDTPGPRPRSSATASMPPRRPLGATRAPAGRDAESD